MTALERDLRVSIQRTLDKKGIELTWADIIDVVDTVLYVMEPVIDDAWRYNQLDK